MVNQVNNGNQTGSVYTNTKQKQDAAKTTAAQTQQAQVATTKAPQDSVNVSVQAQQLKGAQQKADDAPGFDQKKVNELKKAISEGKYQVDAEKLAKNIAAFEFDLYGR